MVGFGPVDFDHLMKEEMLINMTEKRDHSKWAVQHQESRFW